MSFNELDWLKKMFSSLETKDYSKKNDVLPIPNEKEQIDLEHIEKATSMDLPTDFENTYAKDPRAHNIHAQTISDGLILSLSNLGKVDIEYISAITKESPKAVITALKGAIFQNPEKWDECFYKGWETREEYLCGSLRRKLREARRANKKYNGYFRDNVEALRQALPPCVNAEDIYAPLGAPWIPANVIDDFIDYLLGPIIKFLSKTACRTRHISELGFWEIPHKSRYLGTRFAACAYSTYGTSRMDALTIIENTLNQKSICIYDEIKTGELTKSGKPRKIRVLNEGETVLAIERQEKIISQFNQWLWTCPKRKKELEEIYELKYSSNKIRHFDGSFLTFPGLNPQIELFPYQKNAVARILFTPNTLLAHDVGAGKTYAMIVAGMELRRTKISTKNIYVVPNNLVGQWRDAFKYLYKDANLLVIEPKHFKPSLRQGVLKKIQDEDFDGIIIAYSCFEQIPMSKSFVIEQLERQIRKIDELSTNLYSSCLSKRRKALEEKLNKKITAKAELLDVTFDKLGIGTLFLDEAHNYKNVPIDTKISNTLGINTEGSSKCADMLDKVRCVQEQNQGRGVVFATGTPITNSLTDVFVMQTYLQEGDLKLLGLGSFDGWIGMFAERHTDFEVDVDTSKYRLATRFSKFHNLPELTSIFASVADFYKVLSKDKDLPDFFGYTDNLVEPDPLFNDFLEEISRRADNVRNRKVGRKTDNLLLITTDGRKGALDLRLVKPEAKLTKKSKTHICAKNVANLYKSYPKMSQLVFSDYGTPKDSFNVYTEIKNILVSYGIPSDEIEFVHSATTDKKRDALFEKVRGGEIRVLVGSTFKLGLGVNVQDKLIAIHHLDVPWRPADMIQREGRILRQGNTNDQVFIHRYITKGSFDAYSWQLLETKQRFISALLAGHLQQRENGDIYDTALNYAEIKALAIKNPYIKERVELSNELNRLSLLRRESLLHKEHLQGELAKLPAKIENQLKNLENARADLITINSFKESYSTEQRRKLRKELEEALLKNQFSTTETELFSYGGLTVVIPSGMSTDKPFVWLVGQGKHYLELGTSSVGYLVRIDNFLEDFNKYVEKQRQNLGHLKLLKTSLEKEILQNDPYVEQIRKLSQKLEKLDKKLGVIKE